MDFLQEAVSEKGLGNVSSGFCLQNVIEKKQNNVSKTFNIYNEVYVNMSTLKK
jgi:hypothetical protein